MSSGGAPRPRAVLSAIAGSLITIAGLVLSITVVTLQLVSSQYSSRVLRTFLADRLTQITAGAFVGIFGYWLLVLTTIRDPMPVLAGYLIRSLRGATTTPQRPPDHSAQRPCVLGQCPRLCP